MSYTEQAVKASVEPRDEGGAAHKIRINKLTAALVQKLSEIKDLKSIVETTVSEMRQALNADCCQILLANPLDPNSALIFESYASQGLPV